MALHSVETVLRPSTLEEAWEEEAKRGESARFLAGGIDVVLYTPPTVTTLIDLGGLDLGFVRADEGALEIGATASMTQIIEAPAVGGYLGGFLGTALRNVASPLQRNAATLGGTIAMAHPWSDVIPALLVLDAEVILFDGGERTVSLEAFLGERGTGRESHPLICGIRLPAATEGAGGAYRSLTRTAFDVSLLNAACVGSIDDGSWQDVRLAIGGTPALARRVRGVEETIAGADVSEEAIAEAADAAAAAIDARDDLRASAEYRRELAAVLVRRCLSEVAGTSEGRAA